MPQLGDFEWLLRCLKLGYNVEYIPRTTMLYRMHSASVSSNSFRRGQDLLEQLELFEILLQRELFDEARTSYGTDASRLHCFEAHS